MVTAMAGAGDDDTAAAADACPGLAQVGPGVTRTDLGPEWRQIVAAAVAVGREMGVPERGWIVNISAGIQESRLTNLDHGDGPGPDSRGYLQQRDPWGPLAVRMDPAGAARLFYEHLQRVDGWETMPVTVAAQKVQGSGFPSAYARWEGLATELVNEVAGSTAVACSAQAGEVVAGGYALPLPREQIHLPLAEHWNGGPYVDIPAPAGVPIRAMVGGTVAYTSPGNACGLGMEVVTPAGARFMYCHSSRRLVGNGAEVATGQVIAEVGSTGESTGNHLHVQIWAGGANHCPQGFITALMTAAGPDASVPSPESFPTASPCA
jgi:hypothetical protein